MAELTHDEIRSIIRSGIFTSLIGAVETDIFDAKAAPYQIDDSERSRSDHERLELAKDVCGFANSRGGIIVIGVRTERSPTHFGDEVREVRAFPQDLVDPERYRAILRSGLHPEPEAVDIRWMASHQEDAKGLIVIDIPEQPERLKPFLVTRSIAESGSTSEIVFGYMERRSAAVSPLRVQDLQSLLRDGRRFGEVSQRLDTLCAQQEELRTALASRPADPHLAQEQLSARTELSVGILGLEEHADPWFAFAATPGSATQMQTLFREDSRLVRTLDRPPALRPGGFDLATGVPSEIVAGQLRRTMVSQRKLLEIWRDGFIEAIVDSDLMSWGMGSPAPGPLRLNPVALCEMAYSFASLAKIAYEEASPAVAQATYIVKMTNMIRGGHPAELPPGRPSQYGYTILLPWSIGRSPGATMAYETPLLSPADCGTVAYRLVCEVYRWFGLTDDKIPFVMTTASGEFAIDPTGIAALQ